LDYGVVARDSDQVELNPEDEPDRTSIQLYHEVIAGTELRGKDVLEVSCGHGGGSRYIARYLQPRRIVGLDLNAHAIDLCRRHHHEPGLEFQVGDAVHLPFEDGVFDVVISIEASHRYASFDAFVHEVKRVLKPDGHFVIADLRWRAGERDAMERGLVQGGFEILDVEDVTARVVASLDQNAAKNREIAGAAPKLLQAAASDSSAAPGSALYQAFLNGTASYVRFRLRKADD
jgi:SAM-dependent methyltransferase